MVRGSMKQPSEEAPRKESSKKKTAVKKKVPSTGVWPCKINGCNKQFAREADLKRHQRTTKLHSMPGFACPQCEATFTRTDALRRHQKSRHNGVVIEPVDRDSNDMDDAVHSTPSNSRSRSTSPNGRTKENPRSTTTSPLTQTASGPSSYYRQHTATSHSFAPQRQMDSQYSQSIGLPTSATRLHQANWPPPPPWEGASQATPKYHAPSGPMSYYHSSSYYRSNGDIHSTQAQTNSELAAHPQSGPNGHLKRKRSSPDAGSSRGGSPSHGADRRFGNMNSHSHSPEASAPPGPVIDPSLEGSPAPSQQKSAVSLEVTQAAMRALLQSAQRSSSVSSGRVSRSPDGANGAAHPLNPHNRSGEADMQGEDVALGMVQGEHSHHHGHLERPPSMEHMLTEDGEPMLNPAELLTQESLASPPPS